MIKEIKYLIFTIIIFIFLFFTARYYFSDHNIKKSYRSLTNINNKINLYAENLPILENNTNDIEIKPSQIDLGKEINKIGEYEAKINLHADIQAKIHIQVVKIKDDN